MSTDPRAGTLPEESDLIDVDAPARRVHDDAPTRRGAAGRFGTSGHRGTSLARHVQRGARARDQRGGLPPSRRAGHRRPAVPRARHARAVGARRVARRGGARRPRRRRRASTPAAAPRPTPVISHAILTHNRGGDAARADGIVITPSHNPPDDGGFKYNPPHGGPADTDVTGWIEDEANALLEAGLDGVQRSPARRRSAHVAPRLRRRLRRRPRRGDRHGRHPRARAAPRRRPARRRQRRLLGARSPSATGSTSTIVNDKLDPTFRFVPLDRDGKIRMDCSSPYAMARLIELRDRFDVAFANDPDADRHGIVTPSARAAEPQPLPRRLRRLPVRRRPRLGRARRRSARRWSLEHHRPRGAGPRPPPRRGAGRLQVVRRRPARRHARLRRRGERGRLVPAPRRRAVDAPTRTA